MIGLARGLLLTRWDGGVRWRDQLPDLWSDGIAQRQSRLCPPLYCSATLYYYSIVLYFYSAVQYFYFSVRYFCYAVLHFHSAVLYFYSAALKHYSAARLNLSAVFSAAASLHCVSSLLCCCGRAIGSPIWDQVGQEPDNLGLPGNLFVFFPVASCRVLSWQRISWTKTPAVCFQSGRIASGWNQGKPFRQLQLCVMYGRKQRQSTTVVDKITC